MESALEADAWDVSPVEGSVCCDGEKEEREGCADVEQTCDVGLDGEL